MPFVAEREERQKSTKGTGEITQEPHQKHVEERSSQNFTTQVPPRRLRRLEPPPLRLPLPLLLELGKAKLKLVALAPAPAAAPAPVEVPKLKSAPAVFGAALLLWLAFVLKLKPLPNELSPAPKLKPLDPKAKPLVLPVPVPPLPLNP